MNLFTWETLTNVGVNTLAVAGSELLGVSGMLYKPSDSKMLRNVKSASVWLAIDEVLRMIYTGRSNLQNGEYILLLDDLAYYSVVQTLVSELNIAQLIEPTAKQLPFGGQNGNVVSAVVKISANVLKDYIDAYYSNTGLGYVTHVSKWWGY